jgi:hypothetical protein
LRIMKNDSDLIGIRKVETELEGLHLKELLTNEGIDCELFSFHDTMFDGISQNWAEGEWGELRVFKKDKSKALKILEEYDNSRPDSTEQ